MGRGNREYFYRHGNIHLSRDRFSTKRRSRTSHSRLAKSGFLDEETISALDSYYDEEYGPTTEDVIVRSNSNKKLDVTLLNCSNLEIAENHALIDCGAEGRFINGSIVPWNVRRRLDTSIRVRNVDGSPNKDGRITHYVQLQYEFGGKHFKEDFHITHLGDQRIILGMPWLESHNPLIDWRRKTIVVPTNPSRVIGVIKEDCGTTGDKDLGQMVVEPTVGSVVAASVSLELAGQEPGNKGSCERDAAELWIRRAQFVEEEDIWLREKLIASQETDECWIRVKKSAAQQFAQESEEQKDKIVLPPEYAEYKKVFNERESGKMPERRTWDHAIELKPDFKPVRKASYVKTCGA